MTKNTVDACLEFADEYDRPLFLIPSRRQVEWSGGYSNNWNTRVFAKYVKDEDCGRNILIKRDHGGPGQGERQDDGLTSLMVDCCFVDFIHIDPWKRVQSFEEGRDLTLDLIRRCFQRNPEVRYEIGTEEAIFSYDSLQLAALIDYLRQNLPPEEFAQIKYAVIQSGTSLSGNSNTGFYDSARLREMIRVCADNGLLSKEHNGDYLPLSLLKEKFDLGLNCMNIAPEFGQIETQTYLTAIGADSNLIDIFYQICFDSGKWKKWFPIGAVPNKLELINVSGHYVVSTPDFRTSVKPLLPPDIDKTVKDNIIKKLKELHEIAA